MKKFMSTTCLALVASLMLATLAGCQPAKTESPSESTKISSEGTSSENTPFVTTASKDGKYDPGIKLTTVVSITDQMQSKGIDKKPDVLENNIWYRDFKDILGIEVVNEWSVPSAQYNEKLNAQIAANDLPDFFRASGAQFKMLVDYGMAADMTEAFAEHASPTTMEVMKIDNNVCIDQVTVGGKLMCLPRVAGNREQANVFWVRKDWMDKLGIKEPKTTDEFIEMCRRFVTDDPDGNGKNDTRGLGLKKELIGSDFGLNAFGESFHAYLDYNSWVNVNGEKEYGSIQPEAKTALASLASMYKEGLIDEEFIVKDASKINEEVIAGQIGVFSGAHWQAFYPMQDVRNNNPGAEYVALSIVSNDDKKPKSMINASATEFFVVNANCKNPEAVVKLQNYFLLKDSPMSPEFDERYHGKVDSDDAWPVDESFIWSPITTGHPLGNQIIHIGVEAYFEKGDKSMMDNYNVSDNVKRIQAYLDGDESQWSTQVWSGAGDYSGEGRVHYYDENDMLLQNAFIGTDTDSMIQYKATLDQLKLETFTKIIMGEAPIDEFDKFVTQWKSLGGDQITKEVNEAK